MDKKDIEKYVKLGFTGATVIAAGLICYSLLGSLKGVSAAISAIPEILAPFIYGAVIAYLVTPFCNAMEAFLKARIKTGKYDLSKALSIFVALSLLMVIVLLVLLLLIPQLIQSASGLAEALPGQIQEAWPKAQNWLENQAVLAEQWKRIAGDVEARVNAWIQNELPAIAAKLLSQAIGSIYDTVSIIKNFLLGLVVAIYLLARRKQLAAQARMLVKGLFKPSVSDWVETEAHFMDRMFNRFFTGKLLDSAIVGILCFFGCLVMHFESPVLICVVVGVTNIIPFFGPFIGAIPCALILLLENPIHCLMFILFILILQQLDGNVIGPRILGNTTGLSGLWVMFAIFLFGGIWGIGGMIIGVPLMAVIYDVVRQLTFYGIRKKGMGEMIERYNAEFHPLSQKSENHDE